MPTGQPGTKAPHGTESRYNNQECRCDDCRKAHAACWREWSHRVDRHRPREIVTAERRAASLARDNRGTETRYSLGCRCDLCRRASRDARRRRRSAAA